MSKPKMSNKAKAIVVFCAVALLALYIVFFTSDIWTLIRFRYNATYVPPEMEVTLVSRLGVLEGELLPEEEVLAFAARRHEMFDGLDNNPEGMLSEKEAEWYIFYGYYNTMPDGLRRLTENFTRRMNERYKWFATTLSVSEVFVAIYPSGKNSAIYFHFNIDNLYYSYYYNFDGEFTEKSIRLYVPKEQGSEIVGTYVSNTSAHYQHRLGYDTITVRYKPDNARLYKNGNVVQELSTADFDLIHQKELGTYLSRRTPFDKAYTFRDMKRYLKLRKNFE